MRTEEDPEVPFAFEQRLKSQCNYWYSALQRLGKSGNAVTWLMIATNGPHEGMHFAVKISYRVSKPERLESFRHETRFLAECDHPGIMRISDDGVHDGSHPFVVAEFLPQTLTQVIRSRAGRMVEKVSYILQLLSTLKFLADRDRRIIHRDIKPANIFVKGGSCVLGDFGLLKVEDDQMEDDAERILKQSVGFGMPFLHRTPDLVSYLKGESMPRSQAPPLGRSSSPT